MKMEVQRKTKTAATKNKYGGRWTENEKGKVKKGNAKTRIKKK